MRLKTYTAPTVAEAMAMIRRELGEDAIIVSTQKAPGSEGVRIVAALENTDSDAEIEDVLTGESFTKTGSIIREALNYHGVPEKLTEKLLAHARGANLIDPVESLAEAFRDLIRFQPLEDRGRIRPIILVGPPGSGKTNTVAKLAARYRLAGKKVGVITADTIRAGAVAQLSSFTDILEIDLKKARGPESLHQAVQEVIPDCEFLFIDSPGINPFNQSDLDLLSLLAEAADAEPIAVLSAGGDAMEALDMGEALSTIGVARMIATRLDLSRRIGGIISVAAFLQLRLCEVSISPHVSGGLCPITPISLAKLVIPEDFISVHESESTEVLP